MRMRCMRKYAVKNGRVPVTVLVIGIMENNCLVVSDGEGAGAPAMVVDPTGDVPAILDALGERTCEYIALTHNHGDHVMGLPALKEATGARVVIGEADAALIESGQKGFVEDFGQAGPVHVDRRLSDGDAIALGSLEFQVIHTPGHTKGGICLYLPGADGKPGLLFSGDTLFCGTTGRTDFEGGSTAEMRQSLRTKLALLPDDTIVFPGHNELTTIGIERHRVLEVF